MDRSEHGSVATPNHNRLRHFGVAEILRLGELANLAGEPNGLTVRRSLIDDGTQVTSVRVPIGVDATTIMHSDVYVATRHGQMVSIGVDVHRTSTSGDRTTHTTWCDSYQTPRQLPNRLAQLPETQQQTLLHGMRTLCEALGVSPTQIYPDTKTTP